MIRVEVYVVFTKVTEFDCPYFERRSNANRECKHDVPPPGTPEPWNVLCPHIPQEFFEKFRDILDLNQAYAFLCYKKR